MGPSIMTLNLLTGTFQWKFPSIFDANDYLASRFPETKKNMALIASCYVPARLLPAGVMIQQ